MGLDRTDGQLGEGRVWYAVSLLLAAAAYWALANAGLRFGALLHPYVSPVWPSAGFALALILVHGYRFWPAIFIGALAANLEASAALPVAGGIAAANTFSSVFAVYVLRRFADFQPQFVRLRDAVSLILVGALACRALSAIVGTGALWAGGMVADGEFWTLWLNRWVGGAVGVLVVTPFFLAFVEPVGRSRGTKWYAEALLLLVLLAAAGAYVFAPLQLSAYGRYPLAFIPLPIVMWAAMRFDVRGASVASLALAAVSLLGTLQGHGPFAALPRHEAVLLLAMYNGLVAATGLLIAAAVTELKRERSLRSGLEVLRQVFDLLPVGVWITDERGRISVSNPASRRIWGGERQVEPKEYGEYKGWRLPQRTRIEAHDWALARAVEKGESHVGEEIEIEGFDGQRRVIRNSAMPLRDGGSRIAGAIAVHEDVTELIRREQHLRELAGIVEQTDDMVVVTDRAAVIEYVNPAFERGTGYGRDEAIGKTPAILKSGLQDDAFYKELWGKLLSGAAFQHVVSNRKKGGELYYEEKTISPIRDAHGEVTHFVSTGKDITERIRSEEALRESEARFRSLTDMSSDFYWETDVEHRFVQRSAGHNDSGLSMLAHGSPIGKRRWELAYLSPDVSAWEAHRAALDAHRPFRDFEFSRAGADGSELHYSISGDPVFDASGAFRGYRGVGTNITSRKRAQIALAEANRDLRRFRAAMDATADAIYLVDRASMDFIDVNAAGCAMLELTREKIFALGPEGVLSVPREDLARIYDSVIAGGAAMKPVEMLRRRRNGKQAWVEIRRHAQRSAEGWTIVTVSRDITERKATEERLLQLAQYDSLTNLPNRKLFFESLERLLTQAGDNQWTVGVLFIDLDRFKLVNDTLGHATGDELLQRVAARLVECVRIRDVVGRLGGDEFALILPALDSPDAAAEVAAKVIQAFAEPFDLAGRETFITASIGITVYPGDANEAEALLRYADTAMYRAKAGGRNTYRYYTAEMNERAIEKLDLETALRRALERREFLLHFQPKLDLESGKVSGVEALLRWQRPEVGLVSPADFIPLLEETGLIVPVGEWVIRAACAQINAWEQEGIVPVPIAINLSGRQFHQKTLAALIAQIAREHGIDPRLLEFEITESAVMANAEETVRILEELQAAGITISVDDFGTGYSSLAYLKRFPIDAVKIDRSFVSDIAANQDDAAIVLAVIGMAHAMELKVVAEGVETEAQLQFLRANACDEIQGYFFSRPLGGPAVTAFLRERQRAIPS